MIWLVGLLSAALGAALAAWSFVQGQPVAWMGAIGMLLLAAAIRRRWHVLADLAPGTPERRLWVRISGACIVAAHLLVSMLQIGPAMPMHTPAMHILGIDSWTLVAAAVLAYLIVREPQPRFDERDALIAHEARRWAWHFELVLLVLLILGLGFNWFPQLSHSAIAHLLILLLTLTTLAECAHSLRAYRRMEAEAAEAAA